MPSFEKPDIAIVGELNPDLILYGIPKDLPDDRELLAESFTMTLGSSSAILAHNLSLLGTRVAFVACIGSDAFGAMCSKALEEAGVDIGHLVPAPAGVGTGVTVILPLSEKRRILTYPGAMAELKIEQLDIDLLATARHFHLSSLFLHRKLLPDIPKLFHDMKSRGLTTSLDTNDDPERQWRVVGDICSLVDVLFATEQELVQIAGDQDVDQAVSRLSARIEVIVVKRGSRGASVYANGQRQDVKPLGVCVVDTVGAGDSFAAGFLHQWLRNAPIEDCLAYGNVSGACSVTHAGGIEAFRNQLHRQDFFTRHWSKTV